MTENTDNDKYPVWCSRPSTWRVHILLSRVKSVTQHVKYINEWNVPLSNCLFTDTPDESRQSASDLRLHDPHRSTLSDRHCGATLGSQGFMCSFVFSFLQRVVGNCRLLILSSFFVYRFTVNPPRFLLGAEDTNVSPHPDPPNGLLVVLFQC